MNASEMKRLTKMKTENEGNDKRGKREGVDDIGKWGWREAGEVFCGV